MELADGQQLTLSRLLAKGFTYRNQPLEFVENKDNPMVYEAKTKLSDEELAAGNNNVNFVFSFAEAIGNVVKVVDVMSDEDRAKIIEKVKAKQEAEANKSQGQNQANKQIGSGDLEKPQIKK